MNSTSNAHKTDAKALHAFHEESVLKLKESVREGGETAMFFHLRMAYTIAMAILAGCRLIAHALRHQAMTGPLQMEGLVVHGTQEETLPPPPNEETSAAMQMLTKHFRTCLEKGKRVVADNEIHIPGHACGHIQVPKGTEGTVHGAHTGQHLYLSVKWDVMFVDDRKSVYNNAPIEVLAVHVKLTDTQKDVDRNNAGPGGGAFKPGDQVRITKAYTVRSLPGTYKHVTLNRGFRAKARFSNHDGTYTLADNLTNEEYIVPMENLEKV